MNKILDFAMDLGLAIIKDKAKNAIQEQQAKTRLSDYLNRQRKLNEQIPIEEEIDFGGLEEYILNDLMEDIKKRFWGTTIERGLAHSTIINKVSTFAVTHTKLSEKRARKIVSTAVDILANHFRKKVNRDLLFVAGEIEDEVISQHEQTRKFISKDSKMLAAAIEKNNESSIDCALKRISAGETSLVESNIGSYMNAISAGHELFPYYGFRMNTDNKMVSHPLTEEAQKKYPANYKITVSDIHLGEQAVQTITDDIFDRAYRHQLPIYIDVLNAVKYLGDTLDPIQTEAKEMIGAHAIIKPPEFPAAFPCSVLVGKDVIVPYLLLRTKELLEDGTAILSNDEQKNFRFGVLIQLNQNTNKLTFTVKPNNPSNKESLAYRVFLKKILSGEVVTVNALEKNIPLFHGKVELRDTKKLEDEIEFLERVVLIEEYFNISLVIPEEITIGDHMLISRICDLIRGGYNGTWDKFEFGFIVSEEVRQRILELTESEYGLTYAGEGEFILFGAKIKLPLQRVIRRAKILDLKRLKEKINVLENGDEIKIKYIPAGEGKKGEYIDIIAEEEMDPNLLFSQIVS